MGIEFALCVKDHAEHFIGDVTFDRQSNHVVNKLSILQIRKLRLEGKEMLA